MLTTEPSLRCEDKGKRTKSRPAGSKLTMVQISSNESPWRTRILGAQWLSWPHILGSQEKRTLGRLVMAGAKSHEETTGLCTLHTFLNCPSA